MWMPQLAKQLQEADKLFCSMYLKHVPSKGYGLGGVTYIAEQLGLPSHLHVNVSQAMLMPGSRPSAMLATVL